MQTNRFLAVDATDAQSNQLPVIGKRSELQQQKQLQQPIKTNVRKRDADDLVICCLRDDGLLYLAEDFRADDRLSSPPSSSPPNALPLADDFRSPASDALAEDRLSPPSDARASDPRAEDLLEDSSSSPPANELPLAAEPLADDLRSPASDPRADIRADDFLSSPANELPLASDPLANELPLAAEPLEDFLSSPEILEESLEKRELFFSPPTEDASSPSSGAADCLALDFRLSSISPSSSPPIADIFDTREPPALADDFLSLTRADSFGASAPPPSSADRQTDRQRCKGRLHDDWMREWMNE